MSAPIALEAAWERLAALVVPLPAETVPIEDAAGRYLAEDVIARRTQPAADLSAMDGFAVTGEGPWTVQGESRAGSPFGEQIAPGEAVRISTGATMPEGAESVLIVEHALLNGAALHATKPPIPGLHVRQKGFDFTQGDTLLRNGDAIGPAQIALVRAGGRGEVVVARQPRVAILECGDELVADPCTCPPGKLPASNGAMLAAMARSACARVSRIGPAPDRLDSLIEAFTDARDADLLVTSGGASVGEHDLVRHALEHLGAELDFWRVAIRPGKPLLVARLGRQVVIGLPGNPVSSFVTGFLFMLPAIRALLGAPEPFPHPIPIPAGINLPPAGARREFLRGRLEAGAALPLLERDSSALRSLAQAELLIDRPAHARETKAGTPVPCFWLGNGGIA